MIGCSLGREVPMTILKKIWRALFADDGAPGLYAGLIPGRRIG
jgi:hypothetical protein